MRRVHAWLEAEHAKGAKSVRAPELYAPKLNDCAGIGPASEKVMPAAAGGEYFSSHSIALVTA